VEIPYGIRARVTAIARSYPAVQYDIHDPHAAQIEACAAELGITAIAAEGLSPRSMYGAFTPAPPPGLGGDEGAAVEALADALHTVHCLGMPGAVAGRPCLEDEAEAAALLAVLAGWQLRRESGAG
jgi:hypothetical protein